MSTDKIFKHYKPTTDGKWEMFYFTVRGVRVSVATVQTERECMDAGAFPWNRFGPFGE